MNKPLVNWIIPVSLSLAGLASAQQAAPAPAAVEGVKGVKQEAVSSVKQLETGTAAPTGGVTTGAKNDAQAVNKVEGVEVKPPTGVPPPPPPPAVTTAAKNDAQAVNKVEGVEVKPPTGVPPPPPPPAVTTAAKNDAQAVNKVEGVEVKPPTGVPPPPPPTAKVQAVKGVTGLNTAKIQNLEAALKLKQGADTPAGTGEEKGGKGKAAAAALLGAPLDKPNPKAPKEDGRASFQEFEKLQNNGS